MHVCFVVLVNWKTTHKTTQPGPFGKKLSRNDKSDLSLFIIVSLLGKKHPEFNITIIILAWLTQNQYHHGG
jgi:hypothetical protein